MRYAIPASVGMHLGLLAALFVLPAFAPADDQSAESVAVDIISVETFTADNPQDVDSTASETLVAAGADSVSPPEPEELEMAERETLPPVVEPARQAMAEPVEAGETEPLASAAVLTAAPAAIAPVEGLLPTSIAPTSTEVAQSAPPPLEEIVERLELAALSQPVERAEIPPETAVTPLEAVALEPVPELVEPPRPLPRLQRPEPVKPPAEKPPEKKPKPEPKREAKPAARKQPEPRRMQQASLGNGGAAEADQQAAKAGGGQGKANNGGSAAVSRYPGLVQARVAKAVRAPKGGRLNGEVRIMITVAADGGLVKAVMSSSSGDEAIDAAGLAAVRRAAPFPPIPADAGRSTWSFTVPIYIKR